MLITLCCWIVFLVLVTILRPNHMRLCFIRVSPLLMNLGMGSPTSNTLVSWLFDSPATHHHSHTLDPVITRNCSTSEITFQTYHSDDSLLSHLPTFLHHTSPLTPLGTASLWIPILLPKHLSPFSLGNEWHPLFPCRKIHFLLPYGSAEADPPPLQGQEHLGNHITEPWPQQWSDGHSKESQPRTIAETPEKGTFSFCSGRSAGRT